ncbi:hypothetical protein Tco_0845918 [Tanacetum coccineum]
MEMDSYGSHGENEGMCKYKALVFYADFMSSDKNLRSGLIFRLGKYSEEDVGKYYPQQTQGRWMRMSWPTNVVDQKLLTYAGKGKLTTIGRLTILPENKPVHDQQQSLQRTKCDQGLNMGLGRKECHTVDLCPSAPKCHFHHNGLCTQKCHKYNKVGHFARDCRSSGNTNVANTQKGNGEIPKVMVVLNVELQGISREIVQS